MSMSNQQSQRVRRNASPGTNKQGPLRATVPVSLMRQTSSPPRNVKKGSPSNSPTLTWPSDGSKSKHRRSPDSGISPERNSPLSPSSKADNAKTFNIKSVNSAPYIRRTASLDTIYLYSQWQRDAFCLNYCGRLMVERSTQTPDEWDDTKISCQKRNTVSSGDQLEMKYIRQRLQRTNQSSRVSGGMSTYQRHSPIQGDHFAISSTPNAGGNTPGSTSHLPSTPPALPSTIVTSSVTSPYPLSYSVPTHTVPTTSLSSSGGSRTIPIPIPHIPKPLIPRMRSSVEGLNQEIERLVLRGFSSIETDGDSEKVLEPTPDGHRAPIAELFCITHSVDTQTPLVGGESDPSSGATSRSHSISPVIPGPMDNSRPPSMEERKSASPDGETSCKLGTSPHINKFLAREPPDGCEKVKIVEEPRKSTSLPESSGYGSLQPKFVLQPSQSSAFYPLCKNSDFPSPTEKTIKQINSPTHVPTDEKHQ